MRSELQVIVRPFAYPEDYRAVQELWSNAGPGVHLGRSDTLEEIAKKLPRDADLFLVAENQGGIVGTVMGGFDGRRGLVYHLAVSPAARRAGISSTLMVELENRLLEKGCLRAFLLVTQDNQEAMRFYQTKGWEALDLLVFAKDLDQR
jgi:ribosomal protein S18 acetylase RimI-like enzyme